MTIRLIHSLVASFKWTIHQLDVKNALLHGHLTEEVYMKQPPGFVHPDFPQFVCKLKKAIYGLKQAPQAWFHHFSSFILSHDFVCNNANPSMFVSRTGCHALTLLLSADDIILIGSSSTILHSFISALSR